MRLHQGFGLRRASLLVALVLLLAMSPLTGCTTRGDATRSGVWSHPLGENHEALIAAVGPYLVNAAGEQIPSDVLAEARYVVLYFSAGWCRPCRAYTPRLVEFHEAHADRGVQVLLVSSDRGPEAMAAYMADAEMPWLAVPWDRIDTSGVKARYGGRSIPRVVVLDDAGRVVMNSDQVHRDAIPGRVAELLR